MSWLEHAQNLFSIATRLDTLTKELERENAARERVEQAIAARFERVDAKAAELRQHVDAQIGDLRERLARLEVARDADTARVEHDLARFKLELERRLLWIQNPTTSPESGMRGSRTGALNPPAEAEDPPEDGS